MTDSLRDACMNKDLRKAQEALESDSSALWATDDDGRVPLHWAVSFSSQDIVQLLLTHMSSRLQYDKLRDNSGWTPVHIAAATGALTILEELVSKDPTCNLDSQTDQGVTALHLAVAKKHNEVVKYLIDHGSSVRIKDKKKQLPLHRAAAVGSMSLTTLLCDKNSPVNAADFQGWTPLFHALAEGHGDVAVLLADKYGAEYKDIADHEGSKPLDVVSDASVKTYFLAQVGDQ